MPIIMTIRIVKQAGNCTTLIATGAFPYNDTGPVAQYLLRRGAKRATPATATNMHVYHTEKHHADDGTIRYQEIEIDADDDTLRRIATAMIPQPEVDDLHQQAYDAIAARPHYGVGHTHDKLGGRYAEPVLEPAASLEEAKARAEEYTAAGQCGYVMRQDGAILGPDGSWLAPSQ